MVILGVHTPETGSERKVENLRAAVRDAGLKFPVVVDNRHANWNAWGNTIWPAVYLIDKRGDVRYWWYGELKWQGTDGEAMMRKRIEELLSE